jgi:hypothetical protein
MLIDVCWMWPQVYFALVRGYTDTYGGCVVFCPHYLCIAYEFPLTPVAYIEGPASTHYQNTWWDVLLKHPLNCYQQTQMSNSPHNICHCFAHRCDQRPSGRPAQLHLV